MKTSETIRLVLDTTLKFTFDESTKCKYFCDALQRLEDSRPYLIRPAEEPSVHSIVASYLCLDFDGRPSFGLEDSIHDVVEAPNFPENQTPESFFQGQILRATYFEFLALCLEDRLNGYKEPLLCICFQQYATGDDPDSKECAEKARAVINEELGHYFKERYPYKQPLPGPTIGTVLDWQWMNEELQCFRFMYAEMLACYFESIDD